MLNTTCREVHNLLELFFDSELDPRQMRTVALHSATCRTCEEELRQLERLQEVVARTVNEQVDEIDLSAVWMNIEHRIQPRRPSVARRLRLWWSEREWNWSVPAFGAAVAVAAALFVVIQPGVKEPVQLAAETPVSVHEIASDSHVALLSEEDTLLLWVDHELNDDTMNRSEPVNFEEFE